MMRGISILSCPVDWRNNKSLRQWPILDTMIRTRGFWLVGWISYFMDFGVAILAANSCRSDSTSRDVLSVELLCPGPKCTLMKKVCVVGSPNWDESTMLKFRSTKNPVTAWTMPGWSGHESVKMKSALSTDMLRCVLGRFWCCWGF